MPSPAALFASILFSLLGFAAFSYGRKTVHVPAMAIGLVLMLFTYFIDTIWLVYLIGGLLCVALYFTRR